MRRTPARLALFSLVALVASWTALGQLGRTNEFRDAHHLHTYDIVAERSLREHGQWPLWNPWSCGGMYLPGNPQSKSASPATLLSAVMGARPAEGAMLLLFLLLGMEGFYRYLRLRVRTAAGAVLAAPLFVLSGHIAFSWSLGWVQFLGYLLLPWALMGVTRLVRGHPDGILYTGLGFALMLGFGGTYPVPLSALFVVLEAGRALLERRRRAPLTVAVPLLLAGALFTLGLCVFRFWPVLETMAQGPRVMAGSPKHGLSDLLRMFFGLASANPRSSSGIYFVAPVALVWIGVALAVRRLRWRAVFPLVGLLFAFWLAAGYAARPSAFEWLRALPVYETLRYPARFLVFAGLYLAELSALGFFALRVIARRPPLRLPALTAGRVMAAGAVLAVAGWGAQVVAFESLTRRTELGMTLPREPQPFAQARGNRWVSLHFTAIDRGSISCGEAYPLPMSPLLSGNLPAEEYPVEPDAATVERLEWTPNRLVLRVDAARPARVRVNQNYHPGWRSDVGEVVSDGLLLAVDVPEGAHTVTLRFLPRSAIGGAAVSLVALLLAVGGVAWVRRRGRSGRVTGAWRALVLVGLGLLPLGVLGAVAAAWPEPVLSPRLTNPDGGPIVVDALPEDAVPLDVRFALPVRLVGARVSPMPDENGIVPLELYWRVDGAVPRTVGIFVHVTGPGDRKNADHEVVAGTWFFKNAPRGVLLRDASAVNAHEAKAGNWRVWVGLWHASGDGSRVPLFDAAGAPLRDARVDVGGFDVPEAKASDAPASRSAEAD